MPAPTAPNPAIISAQEPGSGVGAGPVSV